MGILNRLKTEGKILIYSDFRNGLLKNNINNVAYATVNSAKLNKIGLDVPSGNNYVNLGADAGVNIGVSDYSVFAKIKKSRLNDYDGVLGDSAGYTGFSPLYIKVNGAIGGFLNGSEILSSVSMVSSHSPIVVGYTATRNSVATFYRNGEAFGTTANISALSAYNLKAKTAINLCRYAGDGSFTLNGLLEYVIVLTVALTATEVAELHAELENMKFNKNVHTNTVSRDYTINKGLVFKHSALKNGKIYNLVNNDAGTLTNGFTSVNTKMGCVLRGSPLANKSIYFADNDSYSFPNNIFSVSFWNKPLDNSNKALIAKNGATYEYNFGCSDTPDYYWFNCYTAAGSNVYGSGYITFTTNKMDMWTITADGSFMYIYRNNTLVKTVAKTVGATMTGGDGALSMIGGFPIGGTANTHCDFKMNGMWNRCLSQDEVFDMYNKTNPLYKTEFGACCCDATTGGNLSNTKYEVISGSFKIATHTINGKVVKCVECVTSGVINLPTNLLLETPQNAANGIWEFYYYAGAGTAERQINFLHTLKTGGVGGYSLYYDGTYDQCFSLVRTASAFLNIGVIGSCPLNNLYKIRIETSQTSSSNIPVKSATTVYINDVLMPVSSGTNPIDTSTYTTSTNMPFYMVAGDKIMLSDSHGDYAFVKK